MKMKEEYISKEETKNLDSLLKDIEEKFKVRIDNQEKINRVTISLDPKESYMVNINDDALLRIDPEGDHIFYGNIKSSRFSNEKYILGEFPVGSKKTIKGYFKQEDGEYRVRPFDLKSYVGDRTVEGRKFIPKYVISKKENGNEKKFNIFIFGDEVDINPISLM